MIAPPGFEPGSAGPEPAMLATTPRGYVIFGLIVFKKPIDT